MIIKNARIRKAWKSLIGFAISLCFCNYAMADAGYNQPGLYLGGDLFYYNHDTPNGAAFDTLNDLGGGGFAGYQFSPYFAIESGYEYFDKVSNGGDTPDHYYLTGVDILSKGIIPLSDYFTLNGFAGVSIINENTYNVIFANDPPIIDTNVTNVMPTIGAGFSLYLVKHLSLDASVLYAIKAGSISSIVSFPLSITLHF